MNYESAIKQTLAGLLAYPSHLQVITERVRAKTLIGIKAHPDDIGRIIGKSGSMIRAIQLIFKLVAEAHGQHLWISVETPRNGQPQTTNQQHPRWAQDKEGKRQALEEFTRIMHHLAGATRCSLSFADTGNHTLVRMTTDRPMPSDLLAAYQTYAKAYGKANGIWITLENDCAD